MTSKLRIRIGEVEIDYEGTEEFLKQELPQLLKTAMELHKASGAPPSSSSPPAPRGSGGGTGGGSGKHLSLTTASIAASMAAKSGSDLLLAAAAQLTLVGKTETFSRQQLLTEMQGAKSYYKKSYSQNLSKYIKTALQKDGPLSETGTDAYALTAATRAKLEGQLANH